MTFKTIAILLFLSISSFAFSQNANRIRFDYDSAGNQTRRYICLCAERQSSEVKETEDLKEEDLQKLNEEDLISFYPNPVQEKLFLKWELSNDKKVSKIELFTFSGQLISSYNDLGEQNYKEIYFSNFAAGTYLINMTYSDGEQKTITIIKK